MTLRNPFVHGIRFLLCVAVVVVWLASLQSCAQRQDFTGFNSYGGAGRANNYETNGVFSASFTFQEQARLSKDDKTPLPGASTMLVPLSFAVSYIPTLDGKVARVGNKIVEWRFSLDSTAVIYAAPVADRQDNFYGFASNGLVYSLAPNGKLRWKANALPADGSASSLLSDNSFFCCDLLLLRDGIVAAYNTSDGGSIVKINFDGKLLWRQSSSLAVVKSCAADEQDNIIAALSSFDVTEADSIVMIAPDGKRRWAVGLEHTRILKMPSLAAGAIYVSGLQASASLSASSLALPASLAKESLRQRQRNEGIERLPVLRALDAKSGAARWTKPLLALPQGLAANKEMVVVAVTQVGLAEPYSALVAYTHDGKELWRKGFAFAIVSTPLLSKENIAFIGTKGEASGVYFVQRDGTFGSVFSISDMPAILRQPAVDYDCNLVFATTDHLGVVRIGGSPVQKLLPY
jgi:outer membrane protein assembly factor BamB